MFPLKTEKIVKPVEVSKRLEELRFTKLKDFPKKDVKIKTVEQFSEIRKETLKYIKEPEAEGILYPLRTKLFGYKIEPQVSDAIKALQKKGYETWSSGFYGAKGRVAREIGSKVGVQAIEIRGSLSPEVIKNLKKMNVGYSKNPLSRNAIMVIDQTGKSLLDVKKAFDKAIKLIPTKEKEILKLTIPWKPGKRITRAEAVSVIEPVTKTDLLKISKVQTVFKDVTKPFPRARGKIPSMEGLIIEARQPIYLGGKEDIKAMFIKPAEIKKTPFQVTYQEQVTKLLPKPPLPKIKTPKPTTIVLEVPSQVGIGVPRMVGGTGEVTSEYWGKGLYERTEPSAVFMPSVTKPVVTDIGVSDVKVVVGIPDVKLGVGLEPRERFKDELDLRLKGVEVLRFEEVQVSKEELIPRVITVPMERLVLRERLAPRLAMVPKQMLISEQVVTPRQTLILRQVPRIRPPTFKPRPPKLRPPKIIPRLGRPYEKRVSQPLRKPVPERGYTFEIRRKGKWERGKVPYAFATKEGAEDFAQRKVLKEAAASYKIVKARKGKKVIRSRMKISPYRKVLFRKAKKEPGVMVQKKLLRILTEGEKREISYAGGIAKMKKAKTSFLKQQAGKKQPPKKKKQKKKGGKK